VEEPADATTGDDGTKTACRAQREHRGGNERKGDQATGPADQYDRNTTR
jgi:hypothetical protein